MSLYLTYTVITCIERLDVKLTDRKFTGDLHRLSYKPLDMPEARQEIYMVGMYADDAMLLLSNVSEACGVAEPLRDERLCG